MIFEAIRKLFKNHFLVMALVCAAPMLAVALLSYSGVIGSWGLYALLLLCPLGHFLMMRGMHGGTHAQEQKVGTTPASPPIEDK